VTYGRSRRFLDPADTGRINPLTGKREVDPPPAPRTYDSMLADARAYENLRGTSAAAAAKHYKRHGQKGRTPFFRLPYRWTALVDGMHVVCHAPHTMTHNDAQRPHKDLTKTSQRPLLEQVKNLVVAVMKLTKAEAAPTNTVANKAAKQAAKAALAATGAHAAGVPVVGSRAPAAPPLPAAPPEQQPPADLPGQQPPADPPGQQPPAGPSSRDRRYLDAQALIMADLSTWALTQPKQDHGNSRWLLMCDAGPRGLLPRSHLPWTQTGSVTFATWWEILQFDGLVYMLRGILSVRRLIILRNLFAVVRLACRGESTLGQPALVPRGLDERAVRAVIAFEDNTPVVMHRHSL